MITIMEAVEHLIATTGVLPPDSDPQLINASALARTLRPKVAALVKRPVQVQTVTVCITRLIAQGRLTSAKLPKITLDTFNMQSGLVELTYPKTQQTLLALKKIHQIETSFGTHNFFAVTYGVNEISIIARREMIASIQTIFADLPPKVMASNLGCLGVQLDGRYLGVPNVIFTIMRALAMQNINIVEIISTYTELIFILAEEDLQQALGLLQAQFAHS